MTDRGLLFLCGVALVVISLGASAWLVVSKQVMGLDGLFMLLVLLTTALCFGLYAWNLIARAKVEIEKERAPKPAPKKAAAPKAEA